MPVKPSLRDAVMIHNTPRTTQKTEKTMMTTQSADLPEQRFQSADLNTTTAGSALFTRKDSQQAHEILELAHQALCTIPAPRRNDS